MLKKWYNIFWNKETCGWRPLRSIGHLTVHENYWNFFFIIIFSKYFYSTIEQRLLRSLCSSFRISARSTEQPTTYSTSTCRISRGNKIPRTGCRRNLTTTSGVFEVSLRPLSFFLSIFFFLLLIFELTSSSDLHRGVSLLINHHY